MGNKLIKKIILNSLTLIIIMKGVCFYLSNKWVLSIIFHYVLECDHNILIEYVCSLWLVPTRPLSLVRMLVFNRKPKHKRTIRSLVVFIWFSAQLIQRFWNDVYAWKTHRGLLRRRIEDYWGHSRTHGITIVIKRGWNEKKQPNPSPFLAKFTLGKFKVWILCSTLSEFCPHTSRGGFPLSSINFIFIYGIFLEHFFSSNMLVKVTKGVGMD